MSDKQNSPRPRSTYGRRASDKMRIPRSVEAVFLIIVLIFFGTLIGFAWVISDVREISSQNKEIAIQNQALVEENEDRIIEIQANRERFCSQVYIAIGEVFEPFVPPRELQTPEQRKDIDIFNKRIDTLTQQCKETT